MLSRDIARRVQKVNDKLGVPVKLPEPTVSGQKFSGIITSTIGAGSVITGGVMKNGWVLLSGAVILAGGLFSYFDAKTAQK